MQSRAAEPQPLQDSGQLWRKRSCKLDFLPGGRMGEAQPRGVKEVAIAEQPLSATAIDCVPYQGVAHPGHVYTHLMGTTGVRPHLQQCVIREVLSDSIHRARTTPTSHNGHALAMPLVAPNRNFYHSLARMHLTLSQRHIGLGDLPTLELALERDLDRLILGDED